MAPHRAKQQHNCRGLPEVLTSGTINVRRTFAVTTTVAPYSKRGFPRRIPESLAPLAPCEQSATMSEEGQSLRS